MTPKSAQLVRARDGTERVVIDLSEFQALIDAATESKHALPDMTSMIDKLRKVFESNDAYIDVDEFLAEYDAAHDAG
jgi:hypothetical protein